MIDVSDGLLLDLGRITVDKGLGARIYADKIPLSHEYEKLAGDYSDEFYDLALSGGEDYELLFTANSDNKDHILEAALSAGTDITEIGIVTSGPGLEIIGSDGNEIKLKQRGFTHFSS